MLVSRIGRETEERNKNERKLCRAKTLVKCGAHGTGSGVESIIRADVTI